MPPRRRLKLVWKLYLLGFAQLVVLGTTVVGVGYLLHGAPPAELPGPPPAGPQGAPPPPGPPPPDRGPHRGGRGGPTPVAPLLTFLVSGLAIVGAGSYFTARWIAGPLATLSATARALGAGDLRARAALERGDELGDVGRAFDEMAARLEKLLLAERELLANVSHELRTPLARIRVALELASEASADGARPSMAEIAVDLAEIESLVGDILTTARLEIEQGQPPSSGFSLHREPIAPASLCERAAARFRGLHPERELRVHADEGLPAVEVDPALLRRAIDNLLDNAHKYSPDAREPIRLEAARCGGRVELAVIDHGMGIAADDLPRVFAPFFRTDRSRSRVTGGVGLGLTLAARIVEAHGGAIELTSAPGAGTRASILLDAAAPATVEEP
jgi:signal transduction histidine kinase